MIVGVGSDLANINRIEETISIFGERFLKRSFAPVELRKSESVRRFQTRNMPARWQSVLPPKRLLPRLWAPVSAKGCL